MKINAVDNQTFGLNRTSRIIYNPNSTKTLVDIVQLQNGKRLTVSKTYNMFGVMTDKLQYLKDQTGNWIKSKLQYFQDGKVVKELKGGKNV